MKTGISLVTGLLLILIQVSISCKKEKSCEGCREINKPPNAIAGLDKFITLPTDSVLLDGSLSNDPDGTLNEWLWTKISGPASFILVNNSSAQAKVKNLVTGVYLYELKVTDNGGLTAKDTIQVTVTDLTQPNRPPVANAGPDQTITLPANSSTINGSASTDPDNNITRYQWTKISGPASLNITNANTVQTQISNLSQGVYQFELYVTDAGGLFSKDTTEVSVITQPPPPPACDISNRPLVNAQLIPVGTLTQARAGMAVAVSGNTILFAGGGYLPGSPVSSRVDIYNTSTGIWSSAELSQARWGIASAVSGNKIFFAGGGTSSTTTLTNVDIYDISTNTWTLAHLSENRSLLSAAAAGNKVVFAGGTSNTPMEDANRRVDIYDLSTNTWSVAMLSEGRFDLSGVAAGSKIYFAGGSDIAANSISTIDIYNTDSNTWSSSSLQHIGDGSTGIHLDGNIYWTGFAYSGMTQLSKVEIRNFSNGASTAHCLSYRRYMPGVVAKNNSVVFFTGSNTWGELKNKFDIYDIITGTWSIGVLPVNIEGASIISVNNTIYVAGGFVNGVLSNQVYRLDF